MMKRPRPKRERQEEKKERGTDIGENVRDLI
jgi:hypothetical protein